ncbi:MAG: hypothetical protein WAW36_12545 [Methylovulum miyakonense]|uniref:hypothetical protein n=1 Tax=Methylovulum miyakonense TaxID=645578 RepID=UPI003BB58807
MASHPNVTKTITLICQNPFGILIALGLALAIIKLFSLYASVDVDDGRWQQFKAEHECALQTGGQGSQRLSWKCNDGKIYYSWRQQR